MEREQRKSMLFGKKEYELVSPDAIIIYKTHYVHPALVENPDVQICVNILTDRQYPEKMIWELIRARFLRNDNALTAQVIAKFPVNSQKIVACAIQGVVVKDLD